VIGVGAGFGVLVIAAMRLYDRALRGPAVVKTS
jgi:hypothetical protein